MARQWAGEWWDLGGKPIPEAIHLVLSRMLRARRCRCSGGCSLDRDPGVEVAGDRLPMLA